MRAAYLFLSSCSDNSRTANSFWVIIDAKFEIEVDYNSMSVLRGLFVKKKTLCGFLLLAFLIFRYLSTVSTA